MGRKVCWAVTAKLTSLQAGSIESFDVTYCPVLQILEVLALSNLGGLNSMGGVSVSAS